MNKKILIIIAAIIILSVTAGIILLFAGGKGDDSPANQMPQEKIVLAVDEQVISPISSFDGSAIWYFNKNGRLFRVSIDGSNLTEFPLPALRSGTVFHHAAWPASGSDIMTVIKSGLEEIKNYYSNTDKTYTELPANVQSFDWLPDGRRIVYVWKRGDGAAPQLVVANADGSGFKILNEVFWPDLTVKASPTDSKALLVRSKTEGEINKVYQADLTTGEFETVVNEGKNLDVMWLANGRKFLFTRATASSVPRVFLYNFDSKTITDLNINTTLAKLTVGSDGRTLFAAVPNTNLSSDRFIRIDLNSFLQEVIYEPLENLRVRELMLVAGRIYFVNSSNSKLYYLNAELNR